MPEENDDKVDQTSGDVVTGVDIVDGVLVLKRHDGSEEQVVLGDLLENPIASAGQAAVVTTTPALSSYGYTQAQATAIITLLNEIRAALIAVGIIKGSA